MIIGYMRNFSKPPFLAELTAMLSKYNGIDIIYMRPKDVDLNKGIINGKIFIDNKWLNIKSEIPPFIDISPYCFSAKNKKVTQYLNEKSILSDNRTNTISKEVLQHKLKSDKKFSHIVIPTLRINDIEHINDFLDKHSTVVMKPVKGERGKGVYILTKENNKYLLGYETNNVLLSKKEFYNFFNENIKNKKYIIQKFINSRSKTDDPFDCRIHVEKNGEGQWVIARKFIRIGIGQKVISNVNQGGGIADAKPFLKANFGDNWSVINQKLNKLGETLPYKYEQLRNTTVMSLGIDAAIDKDGELYLFEVNGAPTTAPLRAEAAMLRTQYYTYVLKNVISSNSVEKNLELKDQKKKNKEMRNENELLKKDVKQYKKMYEQIKNSTSWKITKPLRKVKKRKKNHS